MKMDLCADHSSIASTFNTMCPTISTQTVHKKYRHSLKTRFLFIGMSLLLVNYICSSLPTASGLTLTVLQLSTILLTPTQLPNIPFPSSTDPNPHTGWPWRLVPTVMDDTILTSTLPTTTPQIPTPTTMDQTPTEFVRTVTSVTTTTLVMPTPRPVTSPRTVSVEDDKLASDLEQLYERLTKTPSRPTNDVTSADDLDNTLADTEDQEDNGPSVATITCIVVVGVIVLLVLIAAILFIRRRRQLERLQSAQQRKAQQHALSSRIELGHPLRGDCPLLCHGDPEDFSPEASCGQSSSSANQNAPFDKVSPSLAYTSSTFSDLTYLDYPSEITPAQNILTIMAQNVRLSAYLSRMSELRYFDNHIRLSRRIFGANLHEKSLDRISTTSYSLELGRQSRYEAKEYTGSVISEDNALFVTTTNTSSGAMTQESMHSPLVSRGLIARRAQNRLTMIEPSPIPSSECVTSSIATDDEDMFAAHELTIPTTHIVAPQPTYSHGFVVRHLDHLSFANSIPSSERESMFSDKSLPELSHIELYDNQADIKLDPTLQRTTNLHLNYPKNPWPTHTHPTTDPFKTHGQTGSKLETCV